MSDEKTKKSLKVSWLVYLFSVVIIFLLGYFINSIFERKSETFQLKVNAKIPDWEPRNEIWGNNFPLEYESYLKTLDTNFRSKYAGSATFDYLNESPELVILWAGYAFSKEYKQARGHAYAIHDVINTLRTGGVKESPQPATCWSCKSTDVPRVMNSMGKEAFYSSHWKDLGEQIVNPIGCQDCHYPNTMALRITRPALIEALERRGKKIEDFSHQELRSLVCAQCHVEYYFQGPGKYLTFPWDKGFSADDMEQYYDSLNFSDWTHKLSKVPMLKAQHPDYELYMTGVHASRGIACADCHMPYKIQGGVKFSDHHIQSPLNNIANSCQVCHRQSEEQLRNDVYSRQDKIHEVKGIVEKSLAAAHLEAQIAWEKGATEDEMKPILQLIRHAQWRWDWVAASNSMGFHSPVEALRVLSTAIEKAEKARGLLLVFFAKKGIQIPPVLPDIWTKEKAQAFIGLNIAELLKDKEEFLKTVVPDWEKKAKERQGTPVKY